MAETVASEAAQPQPEAGNAANRGAESVAQQTAEQPADSEQVGAAVDSGPQIQFRIQYGKNSADLKRPASSTIAELKAGRWCSFQLRCLAQACSSLHGSL